MWPVLKHLGKMIRRFMPVSHAPFACPKCGESEGLKALSTSQAEPSWKCESCGFAIAAKNDNAGSRAF